MITAYVIYATIAFWPSSALGGQPLEDRVLGVKASYDTQEQCNEELRKRIEAHISRTGVASVRKELTTGKLCTPMPLEAHYTESDDLAYRDLVKGAVRGQTGGRGVIDGFVK